jgi:hypothetical protein
MKWREMKPTYRLELGQYKALDLRRTARGLGDSPPPPRNSEVLTKLSRIPSSVENTSAVTKKNTGFTHLRNDRNTPHPEQNCWVCYCLLQGIVWLPHTVTKSLVSRAPSLCVLLRIISCRDIQYARLSSKRIISWDVVCLKRTINKISCKYLHKKIIIWTSVNS